MRKPLLFVLLSFLTISFLGVFAQTNSNPWQKISASSAEFRKKADPWARTYLAYHLSISEMQGLLKQASMQGLVSKNASLVFYLPMPNGGFSSFFLTESPVMEKGLSSAFPQIKTYSGRGIEDPSASLRCDITPFGFHAMMISTGGTVFVDPVDLNTSSDYVVYWKKDALHQGFGQVCLVEENEEIPAFKSPASVNDVSIGGLVRNYRLALACTGEYAAYFGGTMIGALSGMVTTMNRVNGVYERELGIHMTMVDNDTLLIFTNAVTDGFSNTNGSTLLGQNQTKCTSLIGAANYDIGHVFSTGGGGIAGLGVVCTDNQKARGVTGSTDPIGDAYDIDYVAHEMGHQFGANHTFNSTVGSCSGNRSSIAAYEPGSASTIMGYAGICGNQDLQPHSDDYFHTKSFDEITTYIQNDAGNSCPVIDTTSNHAPVITEIPANFIIPKSTPFRLTAAATDPEGDSLTYCWEEFDRGNAANWNAPVGNVPIFRSFNPKHTGTRLFPKLENILTNTVTIGEIMASYARVLNFRCVVRDNVNDGAGVIYNSSPVQVTISAAAGPFAVLSPDTAGISWLQGAVDTVTWAVSGSDTMPVNTPLVNVLLSLDGGYTFPIVLGTAVPNNGAYSFVVPSVYTTQARVMVEGAGNIFFDINNHDFRIWNGLGIASLSSHGNLSLNPNPSNGMVHLTLENTDKGDQQISVFDLSGSLLLSSHKIKGSRIFQDDLDLSSLAAGVYFVQVQGNENRSVQKIIKQ
ncbi:MAG: reprolysin-like metallopeptidase [Bacteroidota bacterium]